MASPDWTKIRTDYITSTCSYRELCDKHGVALRSLARKAKAEDWQQQRNDYGNKVATKTIQKTTEKTSETLAEYAVRQTADLVKINELLIGKVYETMAYGDAFSPRDLKSLSGMLTDLMMNYKNMLQETEGGKSTGEDQVIRWVNNEWDL